MARVIRTPTTTRQTLSTPPVPPPTAGTLGPGAPHTHPSGINAGFDSHGFDPLIRRPNVYSLSLFGSAEAQVLAGQEHGVSIPSPQGIEAGQPLLISYRRTPADLGRPELQFDSVLMHSKIDGQQQVPVRVVAPGRFGGGAMSVAATITPPESARGEIEYWFEAKMTNGEVLWDSKYGQNYRANIMPAGGTTIRFDDLWSERIVQGKLKAGGSLKLSYDAERIRRFVGELAARGQSTFGVNAYVSFDGRAPLEVPITTRDASHNLIVNETTVEIPAEARSVSIWFKSTGSTDAFYDSANGRNYNFAIEP